jgi:hypothetical protein
MNAQLAVVGRRSSETVARPGGAPVDFTNFTVPASPNTPAATRLIQSIGDALREMRVRQRQVPGDATTTLRLGLIVTAENGTGLDVQTGSVNLHDLDLDTSTDRQTVLDELKTLEREFLSDS